MSCFPSTSMLISFVMSPQNIESATGYIRRFKITVARRRGAALFNSGPVVFVHRAWRDPEIAAINFHAKR